MAAAFGEHGVIDWDKYKELVKGIDILTYDPPQKKPQFAAACRNINCFTPRSPWCVGFPLCGSELMQCFVKYWRGDEVQHVYLSQADDWFLRLMEPSTEKNLCPEFLKGVWWMKDNVANETVVSMESGFWGYPPQVETGLPVGVKHAYRNWTTGSSFWGSILLKMKGRMWPTFQIDPGMKWMSISKDDWIYILDENDKLVDPQGNPVPFTPGTDLMRISWVEGKPEKGIFYQYILKRVAMKDENGQLVKLPGYQELLDRATRPTPSGCCCNLFLCNISDDKYGEIYDALDDHQLLVPGPEVNPPWNPQWTTPSDIPGENSIVEPLFKL